MAHKKFFGSGFSFPLPLKELLFVLEAARVNQFQPVEKAALQQVEKNNRSEDSKRRKVAPLFMLILQMRCKPPSVPHNQRNGIYDEITL